jgi:integrase
MKSIAITRGPSGRKLKQPFTLEIPETESAAERKLRQYVIDAFIRGHPKLARFTFENSTTMEVAKHLLRHRTGSPGTLCNQIYDIYRFSKWLKKRPDELLNDCKGKDQVPIAKVVIQMERLLADFADNLQEENGLAPATVYNMVKSIQFFFQLNGVRFSKRCRRRRWSIYEERAPTPEELQKTLKAADIRGKVIIALMAVGGFRNGTLVQLKYRHVKRDLEEGKIPIHVRVEPEITKGKRHGYDTFLNMEASEYLKFYLDARKNGRIGQPPEFLNDESPLISNYREIKPLAAATIQDIVNTLYIRAGVLTRNPKIKRYELRAHSLRKFFLTQMISTGTERDYVEYMMGHTLSVYHDVKMKGVDFLRGIYLASGISIQPRTKASKILDLIEITRSWELDPEEILTHEALNHSHREDATTL